MRSDALASRQRILRAARMLVGDRHVTMGELAAAAGVGRSTIYRHFPTRQALDGALAELEGESGFAGVAVALYVVDIDGSQLLRLAGSEEFPAHLDAPPALGPEIVSEGLPEFQDRLQRQFPGCVGEPLWLRGRVTGLLLCVGTPLGDLADIAKQGAAALELANDYTDYIEAARRRKPTTPAAEIQQHLFPPRIARIAGAQLAGALLPSYEVGGDWFDFVENRRATRLNTFPGQIGANRDGSLTKPPRNCSASSTTRTPEPGIGPRIALRQTALYPRFRFTTGEGEKPWRPT